MIDLIKICPINFMIKVTTIILLDKMMNKNAWIINASTYYIKTQLTVSLHIHMLSLTIFIPISSWIMLL